MFTFDDMCLTGVPCLYLEPVCHRNHRYDLWKVDYVKVNIIKVGSMAKNNMQRGVTYRYHRYIRCREQLFCVGRRMW